MLSIVTHTIQHYTVICSESSHDHEMTGRRTRDVAITSPIPRPLHHNAQNCTTSFQNLNLAWNSIDHQSEYISHVADARCALQFLDLPHSGAAHLP